jgi:cation:H+ antiporter
VFEALPLTANLGLFAAAAAIVWFAGTRLARYADAIAEKTGTGRELLGIALLGGVTSLPELAVATTASLAGHPALSVNDLLGSAAINVLILAIADAALGRDALTSVLASPGVALQGVLGIILLTMVVAATMTFDVPLLGASAWTWALLFGYVIAVRVVAKSRSGEAWHAAGRRPPRPKHTREPGLLRRLVAKTAAAGAAVLYQLR